MSCRNHLKANNRACKLCSVIALAATSASGQKRQVNKADGMSDSPPIASGLPHRRFARGEHNGHWYEVYCIADA
jgi:hypothetical protein